MGWKTGYPCFLTTFLFLVPADINTIERAVRLSILKNQADIKKQTAKHDYVTINLLPQIVSYYKVGQVP